MRRASKRNFGLMAIITVMIIASIVGVNALADMVGVGNVACGIGVIALVAGVAMTFFEGSDFVNRNFGGCIIGSSLIATIASIVAGFQSEKLAIAAVAAVLAVLVVIACFSGRRWLQTVMAVAAIIAIIFMALPVRSKEADVQVNVSEDTTPVDDARISELTSENESLKADLEEALQANEALRQFLGEHMKRCNGCPICNGTVDGKDNEGTRKSGTASTGKGTTLPISGAPLGDGKGNGAGLVPVTPVYDTAVPKPGSNEPVKVVTPVKTVDFTNGDDDEVIKVDDNHGGSYETESESDTPVVETKAPAVTEKLTYSVKGNVITVTAPNGFKAVEEPLYYLVAKGNVNVVSATVQGTVLTITFEAAENAELKVCQGMFSKADVKSEELTVPVQKTKVQETEESKEEQSSEETTEESTEVKAEMKVSAINVETICDTGYEGDALQYFVVADGENIDYSKFAVSHGAISVDGTWTIIAPAKSGSATISFGNIVQTVKFTVIPEKTTEESKGDETSAEETEESSENKEPVDQPTEESSEEETVESTEESKEESTEAPTEEETEAPTEELKGTLTSISVYDNSVPCGSVVQAKISYEGNIAWDEVEVSGNNGLIYYIENDIITFETSKIASNYEVFISYNGSTVAISFSVYGVENAEIDWQ